MAKLFVIAKIRGGGGGEKGWGVREGAGERRGEMTQTLYAHMNKRKKINF
jgi:hypothetical protein